MATPAWLAARNGLVGDTSAVDKSSQINQLLGTHAITPICAGKQVVTPAGLGAGSDDPLNFWVFHFDQFDYDQPFTMSGTNIGRVSIPVLPVGEGADLKVSLCADSSGTPGTVLATSYIPKQWINAFAAYSALGSPSSIAVIVEPTGSPLALPQYNQLQCGAWQETDWTSPAVGSSGGALDSTGMVSGNYFVTVGGYLPPAGTAPVNSVFTVPYPGSGYQLGNTLPQPVLPVATGSAMATTTTDTIVVAGGFVGPTGNTLTSTVFVAPWDSINGVVGAWSQQASLPSVLYGSGMASFGENVYVVAGSTDGTTATSQVLWATITNGQLTAWNHAPALPVALWIPTAVVVGNWLLVYGGQTLPSGSGIINSLLYYARINADGSVGAWQSASNPMPTPITGFNTFYNEVGVMQVGGATNAATTTFTNAVQGFTIDDNGPSVNVMAPWQTQVTPVGNTTSGTISFDIANGQWQLFYIFGDSYWSTPVYAMPYMSVPLVASGLTNGATYHILMQQVGGTANDHLRTTVDLNCLPGDPTALFRGRGLSSWNTYFSGFAVPISVCDQTIGGPILHTWEDNGARISTYVHASTPDQRMIGVADMVQFPDGTVTSTVTQIDYTGTWPSGIWPPIGATQIS